MSIQIFTKSLLVLAFVTGSASGAFANKGIGPFTEVKVEELSEANAKLGHEVFKAKCSMCHKMEDRYVGPALNDVFKRRTPEWIANMIMNPVEMTQKDPDAAKLLEEFLTQMTFQDVKKEEAVQIVAYFKRFAEKGDFAEEKAPESKSKSKKKK